MKPLIIFEILILIGHSCASPDETGTTPSGPVNKGENSIRDKWTRRMKVWLHKVNELLRRDRGPHSNNELPTVAVIPDSLTPEEQEMLRNIEKMNKDLEELRMEMEENWSKNTRHIPCELDFLVCQESHVTESPIVDRTSESPERRHMRLKKEKMDLAKKLENLACKKKVLDRCGWNELEMRPCSSRQEPSTIYGMPIRLYLANQIAIYENTCNLIHEVEQKIDDIKNEMDPKPSGSICRASSSHEASL